MISISVLTSAGNSSIIRFFAFYDSSRQTPGNNLYITRSHITICDRHPITMEDTSAVVTEILQVGYNKETKPYIISAFKGLQ